MRGDRSAMLLAMAEQGELMGLSIFDARVPIFEIGGEGQEVEEKILPALFCLDYVECFRWFYKAMWRNLETLSSEAAESLSAMIDLALMSPCPPRAGSPKERMARIVAREIIEISHTQEETPSCMGVLEAIPLYMEERASFLAQLTALSEFAILESATAPALKGCSSEYLTSAGERSAAQVRL